MVTSLANRRRLVGLGFVALKPTEETVLSWLELSGRSWCGVFRVKMRLGKAGQVFFLTLSQVWQVTIIVPLRFVRK